MVLACSHDCLGRSPNQVIHDRKVMRRQVPHYIRVVLEHAEVDSRGVVVVERAERIVVDQIADLSYRACEQKGMVHHDLEMLTVGELDQFLCLGGAAREWFFDEDV